jgi:hypothetical protein
MQGRLTHQAFFTAQRRSAAVHLNAIIMVAAELSLR